MSSARTIVDHMMANDAFSRWLGIEVLAAEPGSCTLTMTLRPEMTNGFHMAHGGIAYALADSALAFAANGHGLRSVSIETSISHTRPVHAGDPLTATAREISLTNKIGIYDIEITSGAHTVALFRGTVYRTGKSWELE
jgi:acyl-CoA thioesterase